MIIKIITSSIILWFIFTLIYFRQEISTWLFPANNQQQETDPMGNLSDCMGVSMATPNPIPDTQAAQVTVPEHEPITATAAPKPPDPLPESNVPGSFDDTHDPSDFFLEEDPEEEEYRRIEALMRPEEGELEDKYRAIEEEHLIDLAEDAIYDTGMDESDRHEKISAISDLDIYEQLLQASREKARETMTAMDI